MSYTTVQNVLTVLPDIGSITTLSSNQINYAIIQAAAYVDAYIAKKYTLPFVATPPLLETLNTDLAIWNLLAKRLYTGQRLEDSPWPARYREALETLADIAKGDVVLTVSGGIVGGEGAAGEVFSTTQGYCPTTSELDWTEQLVDGNKLDAERAKRGIWPPVNPVFR